MSIYIKESDPRTVDNSSIDDSDPIDVGSFAGGVFTIPASNGNTTLTFYHSMEEDGTYVELYDADGAAVTLTISSTAARAYVQPDAVNPCFWVKIMSDTSQFEIGFCGKTL